MLCNIPLIASSIPVIFCVFLEILFLFQLIVKLKQILHWVFFTMVRTIRSIFLVSQKTSCSVNFCDPQRVSKWVGIKGYVCYGMSTNSTSLSMHPTVSILTENDTYQIDVVSSFKFSKLYLRFYIPGLCNLYMLQLTQDSINVFESMEKCMNFINDNGRYTVV